MNSPNQNPPAWLEISVDIHPVAHEALSAFFFDLGCTGIVAEDLTDRTFKAYLPFRSVPEDLRSRITSFLKDLEGIFPDMPAPGLRFSEMEDEDWDRNWRVFFRPETITPRLTVIPAWEPIPESPDGHIIRIDPGPAFGTGQHPTTRMCLKAIEEIPSSGSWNMLDVGTGSGILAMYARMHGAGSVMAIDNDPEALRWAERNVALNNLSGKIHLSEKSLESLKDRFSLVAANLILCDILELLPHFKRVLDSEGWLILSGILRDQIEEVARAMMECELYKERALYEKEWACLIVKG